MASEQNQDMKSVSNEVRSIRDAFLHSAKGHAGRAFFQLAVRREQRMFYASVDWQLELQRFRNPRIDYPAYYWEPQFHGIEGGYLTPVAAITYDGVTAFASPPNERWVRQQLIQRIQGQPQRILDLGCGTGSTTVMLKQAFPDAEVIGLDLSPYMLLMAEQKSQTMKRAIALYHGQAEATEFERASFDCVTASFLFHETPPAIAQAIVRETFRLTRSGGQVLFLDGRQTLLRHLHWLIDLFREPYSEQYAAECMDDWLTTAHFSDVQTTAIGWIHQLTTGNKP